MIAKRPVCICAHCTAIFLPRRTKRNPDADPQKVERCGTCKSRAWNDDDPKVIREKAKAARAKG